jgi:tRNA threonylcarbamoyladenosine biosynthesis protein TsaB
VAQGLAFGAGLPVVAITTLEALSLAAVRGGADQVLACLDARMGEVYWGCFRAHPEFGLAAAGGLAVSHVAGVSVPFTGAYQGIGRGFAAYPELARREGLVLPPGAGEALPDARQMAYLGAIRLRAGQALDPADLKPTYLRDKVAQTEAERAAGKMTES